MLAEKRFMHAYMPFGQANSLKIDLKKPGHTVQKYHLALSPCLVMHSVDLLSFLRPLCRQKKAKGPQLKLLKMLVNQPRWKSAAYQNCEFSISDTEGLIHSQSMGKVVHVAKWKTQPCETVKVGAGSQDNIAWECWELNLHKKQRRQKQRPQWKQKIAMDELGQGTIILTWTFIGVRWHHSFCIRCCNLITISEIHDATTFLSLSTKRLKVAYTFFDIQMVQMYSSVTSWPKRSMWNHNYWVQSFEHVGVSNRALSQQRKATQNDEKKVL